MSDDELVKPEPPSMDWLLTFADLVSLLITFFVLLYSMKSVDESRWDLIYGSLSGVFAPQEAVIFVHPEEFKSAEIINNFAADDLLYLEGILLQSFKSDALLSSLTTQYDSKLDILKITLPGLLFYTQGESRLSVRGRVAMMKLADKLRHLDNQIQVVGFTDPDFKPSSKYPTVWELAMERAIGVTRIMYDRGMPPPIPSFSNGQIIANADAPRVEILIYGDSQ